MDYYHRLFINSFDAIDITLILTMVLLAIALLFYYIAKIYYPKLLTESMSPAFGVMGTIFGFLLGFTIAILWQNYNDAEKATMEEGTNLHAIVNNIKELQPNNQSIAVYALETYITTLKDKEWPSMREGSPGKEGWKAFNNLYDAFHSMTSSSPTETEALVNINKSIDEIGANRTSRIQTMDPMPKVGLLFVIIFGSAFTILSVVLQTTSNKFNHLTNIVVSCLLLSFSVGIVLILTYPFSGSIGVKGETILEEVPGRLEHSIDKLKKQGIPYPPPTPAT